jgi:hypothetical protein
MRKVLGALIAAWMVAGLTGCAAPIPPSPPPLSPGTSPEQAAPSQSPASDSCVSLAAADVTAAIAALPGWSYDFWSTSETLDGTPQPGLHSSAEYVAPDRLRDVAWDAAGVRRGMIIIGDRFWVYTGFPEPSPFDPADFPTWLEFVFPFKGLYMEAHFAFQGDLPGDGLRESPRVADTECLATDPNTGTSLVTTRSGQLVRMTSERRSDRWIETKTVIFRATMPPAIEPPSAEDLRPKAMFPDPG